MRSTGWGRPPETGGGQPLAGSSSSIFALDFFYAHMYEKPTCKSFRLTQAASFCNVSLCFYRNIYRSGGLGQTSVFSSLCLCKAHNDCKKQKEKKRVLSYSATAREMSTCNTPEHITSNPSIPGPCRVTTRPACFYSSHPCMKQWI